MHRCTGTHLQARWAEPGGVRHIPEAQAGRVVGSRAAITAHEAATIPALHTVRYVRVHGGAVHQRSQLLERQVVLFQKGVLCRAPDLRAVGAHGSTHRAHVHVYQAVCGSTVCSFL